MLKIVVRYNSKIQFFNRFIYKLISFSFLENITPMKNECYEEKETVSMKLNQSSVNGSLCKYFNYFYCVWHYCLFDRTSTRHPMGVSSMPGRRNGSNRGS